MQSTSDGSADRKGLFWEYALGINFRAKIAHWRQFKKNKEKIRIVKGFLRASQFRKEEL